MLRYVCNNGDLGSVIPAQRRSRCRWRCEAWDATRPMGSLEGCTAEMQPGRRPSRLAEEASTSG
ncbi:hypothetical protein E4K65_13890 [Bradyrhizobium niftali]|uniref:Uncharacterized protein n=1 Tax=Bradyrhizobium niftali TaxID=2560055 RepID=A0A4Y9LYJ9_9BRAD|nr:hypothetical protein E4K65_13890 [Bradyrhizobium niftali]